MKTCAREIREKVGVVDVLRHFSPETRLRPAGREYVGLSPFTREKTPSFYVNPEKNVWTDFSSGRAGDAITLAREFTGGTFYDALRLLAELFLGGVQDKGHRGAGRRTPGPSPLRPAPPCVENEAARRILGARTIWRASMPGSGTPVEAYLQWRGIDLEAVERLYGWRVPPTLRYHARLEWRWEGAVHVGPAMIGVVCRDGKFCGVHRTWLADGGSGKADLPKNKLLLGRAGGGFSPLTPPAETAIIGEGYETTLSVAAALAAKGRRVYAISALSLPNLAGASLPGRRRVPHPSRKGAVLPSAQPDFERPGIVLPAGVKSVVLLADSDSDPHTTERLLERAAARLSRSGCRVRIARPPRGSDFNDVVAAAR
jgi:hypothetical protein